MTRRNEYYLKQGRYGSPTDALSSLDERLREVRSAEEKMETPPGERSGPRNVIAGLKKELEECLAEVRKRWRTLTLDPLYVFSTEDLFLDRYVNHIKFLYPVFDNVWLTESQGKNIGTELLPFIDFGILYDFEKRRVSVSDKLLRAHLNLPERKSSRVAAHVDLEMLKEDTEKAAAVRENGEEARKRLRETVKRYCSFHDIDVHIDERTVPTMAGSHDERAVGDGKEAKDGKRSAGKTHVIDSFEAAHPLSPRLKPKKPTSRPSSVPPPIPSVH